MKELSLNTAAEMFEMINAESHVFYNTKTGEFDHYNEYFTDDDDCERFKDDAWISTPSHRDIGEYDMMADFTDTVTIPRKKELLCVALEGKGVFRRFKDTLHRVGLTDDWYAFKRNAYAEIVKEWCEEHDLDYADDLAETSPAAIREAKTTVILDTIETIRTRYSCRAFSDRMPSDEDLQIIAGAAVRAPSGMNR